MYGKPYSIHICIDRQTNAYISKITYVGVFARMKCYLKVSSIIGYVSSWHVYYTHLYWYSNAYILEIICIYACAFLYTFKTRTLDYN